MTKRFSILQNPMDRCILCGVGYKLHIHEVFYGTANRKKSIEDGCCVCLCSRHHNMSNSGVHFNKKLDTVLKQTMQMKWEEVYGDREEFRKRYGKSYL